MRPVSHYTTYMRQGDLEPALRVRLTEVDADGITVGPLDLSEVVEVRMLMRHIDETANRLAVPCAVESPATSGIVRYQWVEGDTDVVGPHVIEFEVMWPAGRPQTGPVNSYIVVHFGRQLG